MCVLYASPSSSASNQRHGTKCYEKQDCWAEGAAEQRCPEGEISIFIWREGTGIYLCKSTTRFYLTTTCTIVCVHDIVNVHVLCWCPLQKRTLKGHISVIKSKQAEKMKKKLQEQVHCTCTCARGVSTCTCIVHNYLGGVSHYNGEASLEAWWPAWKPGPREHASCLTMHFYGHPCFAHCTTVLTNPEPCKLVAAVRIFYALQVVTRTI